MCSLLFPLYDHGQSRVKCRSGVDRSLGVQMVVTTVYLLFLFVGNLLNACLYVKYIHDCE